MWRKRLTMRMRERKWNKEWEKNNKWAGATIEIFPLDRSILTLAREKRVLRTKNNNNNEKKFYGNIYSKRFLSIDASIHSKNTFERHTKPVTLRFRFNLMIPYKKWLWFRLLFSMGDDHHLFCHIEQHCNVRLCIIHAPGLFKHTHHQCLNRLAVCAFCSVEHENENDERRKKLIIDDDVFFFSTFNFSFEICRSFVCVCFVYACGAYVTNARNSIRNFHHLRYHLFDTSSRNHLSTLNLV